jgi:hypothetical protein
VGGDTKNAGADPAEIPVDERTAPFWRLLSGQSNCVVGNNGFHAVVRQSAGKKSVLAIA